jgi:acyl carrier protein
MPARVVSHVRLANGTGHDTAVFNVTIADVAGDVVADIDAFCMKRVAIDAALGASTGAVAPPPHAHEESAGALADEMLTQGMDRREGLGAFDRALASDAGPRLVISTGDISSWQARLRLWRGARPTAVASGASEPYGAGSGSLEDRLEQIWRDLLGVASVDPHDNFFEVGGHSLLAVRLLSRIKKVFRCSIPLHQLFSSGTMAGLAALIREVMPPADAREQTVEDQEDDLALTAVPRDQLRLKRTDLDGPRGL